jgi:hypothetical protein
MARLQRPLNAGAVKTADDRLYAKHENDPRPNALFDSDGNRLPLDSRNPSQAGPLDEWKALYLKAGGKAESEGADKKTQPQPTQEPLPSERKPGSPVEPCPKTHWIQVELLRNSVGGQRPSWWPPKQQPPYAKEPFSAEITDGHKEGALNGQGSVRYDGIPCGTCTFKFKVFYKEIEDYIAAQLK